KWRWTCGCLRTRFERGNLRSGRKWTSRFFLPSLHSEHRTVRQLRLAPPAVRRDIGVRPAPIRLQARGSLRSRYHRARVLVVAVLKGPRNASPENLKQLAHELSEESDNFSVMAASASLFTRAERHDRRSNRQLRRLQVRWPIE